MPMFDLRGLYPAVTFFLDYTVTQLHQSSKQSNKSMCFFQRYDAFNANNMMKLFKYQYAIKLYDSIVDTIDIPCHQKIDDNNDNKNKKI